MTENHETMVHEIIKLIARIYPSLKILKQDYCIIGSAALALSGIQTPVYDFDILTSTKGAETLKRLWIDKFNNSYLPENLKLFRSNFGRFDFDELPVEVMGDLEVNKSGTWVKVSAGAYHRVVINGMTINVPNAEQQKNIFLLLGREKDLVKIKLVESYFKGPNR